MAFSDLGLMSAAPPMQLISICSTRPVQEPQELAALVCFLISSTVNRPCSRIAFTMVPLHTPLQPQISVERSEEHTSELQSLMRISYAVFCLIKKKKYSR